MRHLPTIISAVILGVATGWPLSAAQSPPPAQIDYAYFTTTTRTTNVVVIGANFVQSVLTNANCQTRGTNETTEWVDAGEIRRAKDDEFVFKPGVGVSTNDSTEVRVRGADGNYTSAKIIGLSTNYWERFLTFGSPHDCLGNGVQIKWCKDAPAQLGSNICPDTKHAFACQQQHDYAMVGIYFATGSVSAIRISFDYTQIDLRDVGPKSNSELKRTALKTADNCPLESSCSAITTLTNVCTPAKLECFPAENTYHPGSQEIAVFYVFKRNTWPAVLNINNVHIETTMTEKK